ncbi:MAG: hypothetical protein JWM58_3456 [Rhizobium sp.]|nr:hypothetical protein [Rhizobium sp.]
MKSARANRTAAAYAMAVAALGILFLPGVASAAKIKNAVAVFSGLDKITGRTTAFDVYIDETVQFGALQVTPKVCYSRDETEAQKIDGFIEVDEITLDRKIRRIFTGWMFAASPGLNAVDHPIYDVWLTGCKQSSDVPAPNETKTSTDTTSQPLSDVKPVVETKPDIKAKADTVVTPQIDPNADIGLDN